MDGGRRRKDVMTDRELPGEKQVPCWKGSAKRSEVVVLREGGNGNLMMAAALEVRRNRKGKGSGLRQLA